MIFNNIDIEKIKLGNRLEKLRQNKQIYNFAIKDNKIIIEPIPRTGKLIFS